MLIVIITGIWICQYAADQLGVHDFGGIVWDEIAGYLVTLWLIPFSWNAVILGFILFRIFDIFKPWPIGKIDRQLRGGLGIMMDDVLAGFYALGLLALIDGLGLI
jgi:phosphatidylglycerophosphatase A